MAGSEDKQWASKYLLDPLNAPQPADETGPGTSFAPKPTAPSSKPSQKLHKKTPSVSNHPINPPASEQKQTPTGSTTRSSNNPYRNATTTTTSTTTHAPPTAYPSPPQSASPNKDRFSTRTEAFPDFDGSYTPTRQSISAASTQIPTSTGGQNSSSTTHASGHRRRTSSLNQRYPGDQSHRPLAMLTQDAKTAHRAPHLRKKNQVGADSVDRLDDLTGPYHHEGPYDATLLARNNEYTNSPLEAVSATNEEALKATPRDMIKDSVEKHRPLDGVAIVPPGHSDRDGNTYHYTEGSDMMIDHLPEGGAYKRWPGMKYLPEDLKGKGEPSFSVEKALKDHKRHARQHSDTGGKGIEMTTPAVQRRPLSGDGGIGGGTRTDGQRRVSGEGERYKDWEGQGPRRSVSGAGRLRKRFGGLSVGGH